MQAWQKAIADYCYVYGVIHFTSPAGWLHVHRDQLRAQRSVTSMGKLYLLPTRLCQSSICWATATLITTETAQCSTGLDGAGVLQTAVMLPLPVSFTDVTDNKQTDGQRGTEQREEHQEWETTDQSLHTDRDTHTDTVDSLYKNYWYWPMLVEITWKFCSGTVFLEQQWANAISRKCPAACSTNYSCLCDLSFGTF